MGNILLGLIPALGWGVQPLILQKIGGKTTNQQMGMAMGAFLFSLGVLIFHQPETWSFKLIAASFICGFVWSLGQITQIKSFHLIGVSTAMPISTGMQLIGVTLVGIFYFHEWTGKMDYIYGISAIVVIIIGVFLTAFQENKETANDGKNMKQGIIVLLISTVGQVLYNVIPRVADINGWDAVVPQSIGMLLGSMLFSQFFADEPNLFGKKSFQNILAGIAFAVANITIMLSNAANGVALGFTLSQMNVLVSTIGGLLFLKESKTSQEMKLTIGGLLLIAAGGILIGLTK